MEARLESAGWGFSVQGLGFQVKVLRVQAFDGKP